jgi:hypothetical protein
MCLNDLLCVILLQFVALRWGGGVILLSESSYSIPIEQICRKILNRTTLDIFYLISNNRNLSKSDIAQIFKDYDPDPNAKVTKYRSTVELGIATLEGALFIENWKDGQSERYILTPFGEAADKIVTEMFDEVNDNMLLGCKIIPKKIEELQAAKEVNA